MKLSQLYANTASFKAIKFNPGVNVILGKVTKKYDHTKDSHNLGKSTLITVLDFMLLKKIEKEHIFKQFKTQFHNIVLYLEILLDSGDYLTIRRSITDPTKVSFKINHIQTKMNDDFDWTDKNISIDKAVKILNEFLGFNVLPTYEYRKSITYFLRSQSDYKDIFQLGKFQNGKHVDWKPFIFDLLGFNGELLREKYGIESGIETQKTFINNIQKEFSVNTSELDRIKGNITLKKEELKDTRILIDNFNFYSQERELNKNLIENIEASISELNSIEYTLTYELDKMQNSMSNTTSFNLQQLQDIYKEVNIYFSDKLVRDYQSLEKFNLDITSERNKYLKERCLQITKELTNVRQQLEQLDKQRNESLSILHNKNTFDKFKAYQIRLTKLESEIFSLEEQLKSIDKISSLKDIVSDLKDKVAHIAKLIQEHIKCQDNAIIDSVRRTFNNVFRKVFNVPALLYIEQNSKGNIEFRYLLTTEDETKITAESNGNTYRKMLCVAFDISLLVAYNKSSFYKFVYHDGVLEGLDNRKKRELVSLILEYSKIYDIQYIFTAIEDDLPQEIVTSFSNNEICLTLSDEGDEGKLFGFSF